LAEVAPNPFNPVTRIAYDVPTAGHVTLTVHALDGSLVKTLVDADLDAGRKTAAWRGRNQDGRRAASGAYILRLASDQGVSSKKVVLAK
jgi:flagellar hook assembly protein FlgD